MMPQQLHHQVPQPLVTAPDRIVETAAEVIRELAALSKKQILRLSEDGDMGFSEEFDRTRMVGQLNYTDEASSQENRPRNRYRDVLPSNENRVVLEDGGYINASFLQSPTADLPHWSYVAAQGPLVNTIPDFWAMAYENKFATIVMLTQTFENSIDKCSQYFPLLQGETVSYGNYKVTLKTTSGLHGCRNVEVRTMDLSPIEGGRTQSIEHFLYKDWPDHGVPQSSSAMRGIVHTLQGKEGEAQPIIVHCSAGIGRTGTYCCIDIIVRRLKHALRQHHSYPLPLDAYWDLMNVTEVVKGLRRQRRGMVQTLEQFIFCHLALQDELEELAKNGFP